MVVYAQWSRSHVHRHPSGERGRQGPLRETEAWVTPQSAAPSHRKGDCEQTGRHWAHGHFADEWKTCRYSLPPEDKHKQIGKGELLLAPSVCLWSSTSIFTASLSVWRFKSWPAGILLLPGSSFPSSAAKNSGPWGLVLLGSEWQHYSQHHNFLPHLCRKGKKLLNEFTT